MKSVERLRGSLPDLARDVKLNLENVLAGGSLSPARRWGVAVATAAATRNPALRDAVAADALEAAGPAVVEDGLAAATLMAMNNVYYRFRHLAGKPVYSEKPARLRMNRMVKPATSRPDFELMCLAVSAMAGCETCIQAHERVVLEAGMSEDEVHDAVRLAATMSSAAVALELAAAAPLAATQASLQGVPVPA